MASVIEAFSIIVAAISVIYGVNAWRREFTGKRRIELAESVLAMFYEAEDAIRALRSPASHSKEADTRERSENERQEEAQARDRAFIVFERYRLREDLFARLQAAKYQFMAAFGRDSAESFDEISAVRDRIIIAAEELGLRLWPRHFRQASTGAESEADRNRVEREEAIILGRNDGNDEIAERVRKAVHRIEEIAKHEITTRAGYFDRLKNNLTKRIYV